MANRGKGKISFKKLAEQILREEGVPLSAVEIWERAVSKGYDRKIGTKGKTPWRTIGARIYVDMRENPNSPFIKVGSNPVRFGIKGFSYKEEGKTTKRDKVTAEKGERGYRERDLHPLLTYYARMYMNVYTKTIFHERSKKRKFSQWLHPDMVGVSFPKWEKEVLELAKTLGRSNILLYSFEIKKSLTFSNLREAFFQAVSNSSWANEGYLVAAYISEEDDFLEELERLSNSFGIGIIQLNPTDPDASGILYRAKRKERIDWATVNKLCEENSEFKNFLKGINNDIRTNEVRFERYDKLFEAEELSQRFESLRK